MSIKTILWTFLSIFICTTVSAQNAPGKFLLTRGQAGPAKIGMDISIVKQGFSGDEIAKKTEMKEGVSYPIYAIYSGERSQKCLESLIIDVDVDPPKETVYSITAVSSRTKCTN